MSPSKPTAAAPAPAASSKPSSSSAAAGDAPAPTKAAPTTDKDASAAPAASTGKADAKEDEAKKDAAPAAAAKEDEGAGDEDVDVGPPSSGSVVDMDVFGQLLEIDDDESHEFSKTLAFDYISQAEGTFVEIEEALASRSLDDLSKRGHFLKGSSAALGLQRVQHSCEAMQHFGKRRDARGEGPEVSEDEALARCRVLLKRLRKEQEEAKEWLEGFYKTK
ncbi:hypothetical protein JCM6882_000593 [Rhodosporidiobolus microsporus]